MTTSTPAPAATSPEAGSPRPRRWRWVALALVVVAVAVEVWLNVFQPPRGYVEIINKGNTPVVDLRLRCDGRDTVVGTIAPGATVGVYVVARESSDLVLRFRQAGNPITAVEVEGFSPREMARQSQKQVVALQEAGVERYMDDDPSWTDRAWRTIKEWFGDMFL